MLMHYFYSALCAFTVVLVALILACGPHRHCDASRRSGSDVLGRWKLTVPFQRERIASFPFFVLDFSFAVIFFSADFLDLECDFTLKARVRLPSSMEVYL
jgi:hypothetical protein